MQKRIERMQKLVELAQNELDQAAQIFQSLQQQFSSEQVQLEQLKTYLTEYIEQQTSGAGSTLQQLKSTNAFMDKLNKAIEHQHGQLAETETEVQRAREFWIEKRSREQVLVKLTEKLKSDHSKKLDKIEQKLLNELSTLNYGRGSGSEDSEI